MIRVGFTIDFNVESWIGGVNYFRNLLRAVYAQPDRKIEAIFFAGKKADKDLFKDFPPVEVVRTPLLDQMGTAWVLRKMWMKAFGNEMFLERLLLKHGVKALSHAGPLGNGSRISVIGWIPDFQHVYLKKFFSQGEIYSRDKFFREICMKCKKIIVSSLAAQKELTEFFPMCAKKSSLLQFAVGLPEKDTPPPSTDELETRYRFRGNYFFVSNQFWAHKNHMVILEALKMLKSKGRNAMVIASGSTQDYRQPDYFNSLMSYVKKNNLGDSFRPLGLIPREDVIALMLGSVALINPSFFEGWSTTVEEAKSAGKRIILSDIPVHREQDPPGGVFFSPKDAETLAWAMWTLWSGSDPEADRKLMEDARKVLPGRLRSFAKRYEEIVISVSG